MIFSSSEQSRTCRRELRAFQEVGHHDNIIHLFGTSVMGFNNVLVLEYAENGDLETLLMASRLKDHPEIESDHKWTLRTRMAHDVAQGMTGLYIKNIVHFGLEPSNILVGKRYVCKVCNHVQCLSVTMQMSDGVVHSCFN